jgi:hypothetical protein
MSPEVAKYCKRAIIDYMAGNFGEYERLVNKAIETNKNLGKLVRCKYKINGQWIDAKIDFTSGNIYSLDNKVLRLGRGQDVH